MSGEDQVDRLHLDLPDPWEPEICKTLLGWTAASTYRFLQVHGLWIPERPSESEFLRERQIHVCPKVSHTIHTNSQVLGSVLPEIKQILQLS